MVPEGWELKPLKAVTKIYDGTHQTPRYVEAGVPFYSVEHVTADRFSQTKYISEDVFEKECQRVSLEKNDILMTRIGDIGTAKEIDWDVRASFYVSLALIKKNRAFNSTYLENYINSRQFRSELWKRTIHVAFPKKINLGEIGNCEVLLPPLPEQKKIAQILSTWDQAITATERLLENSQQRKKGLMQQLLTGNTRLPGFEGEWKSVEIKDLGEVVTGFTPPKSAIGNYGEDFSWATAEDFKSKYVSNTKIKISRQGLKNKRLLPKGSVLVTCIASIGRNAIANEDLCTNQQINSIIVNECNSNEFVYYQVEFSSRELLSIAGTTAVPIVNKSSFEKIKLSIPPLKEQNAIADILMTADLEIDALKQRLSSLTQEKKALMQQLLTGKRRVQVETEAA